MKIEVTTGEVPIRDVTIRRHAEGLIYTVTIGTPVDKHPIASLGMAVAGGGDRVGGVVFSDEGIVHLVDIYRASGRGRSLSAPSRVSLLPEGHSEQSAFRGGLCEIDWGRWQVTLITVSPQLMEPGYLTDVWERFEAGRDYLGDPAA